MSELKEKIGNLLTEGKRLAKEGHCQSAIKCFEKANDLSPDFCKLAWFGISYCYSQSIFLGDEVFCYDTIVHNLKESYVQNYYDLLIFAYEVDAEPWNNRGLAFIELWQDDEQALYCFDKALEINPDIYAPLRNKAVILMKQGKDEEAMNLSKQVEKLMLIDKESFSDEEIFVFWNQRIFVNMKFEVAFLYATEALKYAKEPYMVCMVYEELEALLVFLDERHEEAADYCSKILELGGTDCYWGFREHHLCECGKYEEAVALKIKEAEKFKNDGQMKESSLWYSCAVDCIQEIKKEYNINLADKFNTDELEKEIQRLLQYENI